MSTRTQPIVVCTGLFVLTIFFCNPLIAQRAKKLSSQMPLKEKKKIDEAIKVCLLDGHRRLIMTVSDPDGTQEDLNAAIENSLKECYYDENVPVEIDYVAGQTAGSTQVIKDYLKELKDNFKVNTKNAEDAVVISGIDWNGNVFIGDNNYWSKVSFRQLFNGKDQAGKTFIPVNRVAEIQLIKNGNEWRAYISSLYFAKPLTGLPQEKIVVFTGVEEDAGVANVEESDAYYESCLKRGTVALQNRKYGEAYFFLNEARKNKTAKPLAEIKIDELKTSIRSINRPYDEYIFAELKKEGTYLAQISQYARAKAYYQYASFLYKAGAEQLKNGITQLDEKIRKINSLRTLFDNGNYEEALATYRQALIADKDNSALLAGMARCYGELGMDSLAEAGFAEAIRVSPENIEAYKWQAEFYKRKKNYKQAAKSYSNLLSHLDPYDWEASRYRSLFISCEGLRLYSSSARSEAMDSFKKAVATDEKNCEAYVYLSKLAQEEKRDFKEALLYVKQSITHDSNYAPGYIQQADLLCRSTSLLNLAGTDPQVKKNKKEALALYSKAIAIDKRDQESYLSRGKLYLELQAENEEYCIWAKNDFTQAIKLKSNAYQAYHYRGKCNYRLGEIQQAIEDFKYCEEAYADNKVFAIDYGFALLKSNSPLRAELWFNKTKDRAMGKYGAALLALKLGNSSSNYQELLKSAFESGEIKRETVQKDFSDLQLANYLADPAIKTLLKKLR